MQSNNLNVEISLKDLEALMMAAAAVRGVYSAVDSHRQDAAVMRTRDDVSTAISNASRCISNARRIKDPMEDEDADQHEVNILKTWTIAWKYDPAQLDPRDPTAVSILRKRLAVMGHLTATVHWGDKTTETRSGDKLVWKLTPKGAAAVNAAFPYLGAPAD